jgi:pimeloyl-ACP methyl ester carboxylesterase
MATAADPPETTASAPPAEEGTGRGHIGLIVLGSIVFGLILGLVLVLGVFGGGREHLITGAALLSLGLGMLMLFELARRRTDQPQPWALAPAVGLGVVGLAVLVLGPSGRVLGWLGWVWPLLLAALVVWSWRGARHSLHNWSRRALLYPSFVILGLVALGGAYETISEATTSNEPATGRTYLVAGHRLYLSCAGSGSPTVVLFNGLAERTPSWAWVQRGVAVQTRVCVFDRAGQGWSGKAPGLQDAHQLSADVDGLLAAAKVPGPYVVAGHSVGGAYALAYAMDFPKNVAGVALLDSATPHQFDLSWYPTFYALWRRGSALLPTLARAGVARIYSLGMGASTLPPDARRQARAFSSLPREVRADRDEFAELKTVLRQAQALKSLDGKPLFVLTADLGQQSGWFAAQDKLAALSTNSAHQRTQGATHVAFLEDEHFAAVSTRAIAAVVRSVRTGTPLAR